jgi:hypothetical protein
MQQSSSYSVDVAYHTGTNGHPDNHSPNSSHLSVHSGEATLVSRTQKQQTTQQVGEKFHLVPQLSILFLDSLIKPEI